MTLVLVPPLAPVDERDEWEKFWTTVAGTATDALMRVSPGHPRDALMVDFVRQCRAAAGMAPDCAGRRPEVVVVDGWEVIETIVDSIAADLPNVPAHDPNQRMLSDLHAVLAAKLLTPRRGGS